MWDPVLFLSKPTKLKTKTGRKRGPNGGRGGSENKQLPKVPNTKLFSDAKCPEPFLLLTKYTIIVNPNKDTQLAATFSKRVGKRVFTSRQLGLKPCKQPLEFPNCVPFSLQRNKGL